MNAFKNILTGTLASGEILNVFKSEVKTPKGEETRARVLETALRLFREKGFDATTMRDIAQAAGLSLGAAYHYFPSKEAIVLAYYDRVQDAHADRARESLPAVRPVRARLGQVLHAKLEILEHDRPLMGALLRFTGDATHPLSFLGEGTRDLQFRSMAVFAEAFEGERLPKDLQTLVPTLAWAMHMGLLLYFLYDTSPGQTRTKRLTDGAVDLFVNVLSLMKLPILRPVRRRIVTLLTDAGLVPTEAALARHRLTQHEEAQ
jgi:AcrR family transcriptional regulator